MAYIPITNAWGETIYIKARFLGAGAFAKCYLAEDGKVYSYVKLGKKYTDYSKEILSGCDSSNPHIPDIIQHGYISSKDSYLYEMDFYSPLTKKNLKAWEDFRALKKAFSKLTYKDYLHNSAYSKNCEVLESLHGLISESLYDALEQILSMSSNYGDNYIIEIAQRNLKVDSLDNLILLDILFNPDALDEKIRK